MIKIHHKNKIDFTCIFLLFWVVEENSKDIVKKACAAVGSLNETGECEIHLMSELKYVSEYPHLSSLCLL